MNQKLNYTLHGYYWFFLLINNRKKMKKKKKNESKIELYSSWVLCLCGPSI